MIARSTIDLLTNHTILRGFDDRWEILGATLGAYPPRVLPQFTHELAHHWCFSSPVGLALALLELEAAALAITARPPGRARDAIIKAQIVTAILRPITEGLAQFAEFDVMVTRHGQLVSNVVKSLPRLFAWRKEIHERLPQLAPGILLIEDSDDMGLFAWPLTALRTLPQTLDRKSGLLSSPLSIKGDAYLLGYLMVKTLWIWSYTKYWRMNDTDLFMMMLRAFIFSDSRLVRMLLDPEPLTNKSLNELVHYCVQRQFGFPSVALESMVTAFEQGGQEEPSGTMFDVENAPWEDPESSRSANGMIAEALEWLGRDGGDKRFLELATVLVQRREAMQIFRRMVDYERGEDGLHTFYNGEFVYGIDKGRLDQIQYSIPVGASGHAELVLCFKPRSGAQFCVLKLESPKLALFEPVARGWSGGLESSNSMGTGTSDEIAKLVRLGVEHAKRRSGQDFARAESLLLPQVERDYLHLALATASNKEAVREKMQEAGFWSLFDGDTVAVERLARLSCWSSLCLTHEGLEWWCDRHGFGFREASEQLLKYCETTGFEFFALNDDGRPLSLA